MAGKVLAALGMVAAIPWVTRELGAATFGEFGLWLALAVWVSSGCGGWLASSVIRFHKREATGPDTHAYRRTLWLTTLLTSVLAGGVVFAVTAGRGELSARSTIGFAFIALFSVLTNVQLSVAKAELRAGRVALAEIARAFGLLASLWFATTALDTLSLELVVACYAAGHIACFLVLDPTVSVLRVGRPSKRVTAEFARYGLPMGAWFFVSVGHTMLARPVLDALGLQTGLGYYVAIQDLLIKGGTLAFMPLAQAVATHAMADDAQGKVDAVQRLRRRAFTWMSGLGVVFVLGATASSRYAGPLLFGDRSSPPDDANLLVFFLALGVVVSNLAHLAHLGLQLAERTGLMVGAGLLTLVVNALGCWLLVPQLGAFGAAVAYLLAQLLYVLATAWLSRRAARTSS